MLLKHRASFQVGGTISAVRLFRGFSGYKEALL